MDTIIGQSRAVDVLERQLMADRLHHAYIFHGPVGVGKFTTATAFAGTLLCHNRQQDMHGRVHACGGCESCLLLKGGAADEDSDDAALGSAHPDLHIITKELARYSDDASTRNRKLTTIPVDVLRQHLIEPAYRSPQLAGGKFGKVFVVDESELLNPAGQNALLKTLEEPPTAGGGTTIILVTSSEDRLLPTIRSRCQRVAFVPLADSYVRQWLSQNAQAADAAQLDWVVDFAGGSLGRAKLALDHDLYAWARTIIESLQGMSRGRADGELGTKIAEMIDSFAKGWVDAHKNASKEAANKMAADLVWSIIMTVARGRLQKLSDGLDPADPIAAEAVLEPWARVIDHVQEAQRMLSTNVNLGVVCDYLVSQLNGSVLPARA